jgi:hypothetical protein
MGDLERRRLYAEKVRQVLLDRGTPVEAVSLDDHELRRQLREWVALLELRRPLTIRSAPRLVLVEPPPRRR